MLGEKGTVNKAFTYVNENQCGLYSFLWVLYSVLHSIFMVCVKYSLKLKNKYNKIKILIKNGNM